MLYLVPTRRAIYSGVYINSRVYISYTVYTQHIYVCVYVNQRTSQFLSYVVVVHVNGYLQRRKTVACDKCYLRTVVISAYYN